MVDNFAVISVICISIHKNFEISLDNCSMGS